MGDKDDAMLELAGLLREATAMTDAALGNDIADVRNRAYRILHRADNGWFTEIAQAASRVLDCIREEEDEMRPGCGKRMLELANAIDAEMSRALGE